MQHPIQALDKMLTTEETAYFLGKTQAWLRANRETLKIPSYKIGKQYRFKRSEIFEWLENQYVKKY